MLPNDAEKCYELSPVDKEALGDVQVDTWPYEDAESLLQLAQANQANIENIDTSEFPKGAQRTHIEQRKWKLAGHLTNIIRELGESGHLPSPADGAEAFLRDQPK